MSYWNERRLLLPRLLLSIPLLLAAIVLVKPLALAGDVADLDESVPGLAALAQQKADTLVNNYGVTSVQYAVVSGGDVILSGNAGVFSRTENRPITADTIYGIGSTSKMFTATAIMILVERGLVDLDAPVTTYIPEFTMADARYKQITVRMLLNHSSGLMGATFRNAFLIRDNDPMAHDALISELAGQRLKADPGEYSVYCNDGLTLAELVVERVSNESFSDFIRNNITAPLGMNHTATSQDDFDHSRMARTYVDMAESYEVLELINVIGTGGVYSTAEDLGKFAGIFMYDSVAGADILSAESLRAMANAEYANGLWPEWDPAPGIFNYGLGWDSVNTYPFTAYGIKAVVKGGDTMQYHSSLLILPEYNLAATILTSGGSSTLNLIVVAELLQHVLDSKGALTAERPTVPTVPGGASVAVPIPPTMLEYSGLYAGELTMNSVDLSPDGSLSIVELGDSAPPAEIYAHIGDGVFVSARGDKYLNFVRESNDRTYIRRVWYLNIPGLGHTAMNDYIMQKLAPVAAAAMSDSIREAWLAREGHYYPINEKYSSLPYLVFGAMMEISISAEPGYVGTWQIVDENNAVSSIKIPGLASRDLTDIAFYTQDGCEYLKSGDMIYIGEKDIPVLATTVTSSPGRTIGPIGPDGYAIWYRIADVGGGGAVKIVVDVPMQGAFAIYEGAECTEFSWITGHNEAILPAEGMIVFAGDPGVVFAVSFQAVEAAEVAAATEAAK